MLFGFTFARLGIYAAVIFGVWIYGFSVGINRGNVKIANAKVVALQVQQQRSEDLAKTINDGQAKYEMAIKAVTDANSKLIASLHNRPYRIVSQTTTIRPECAGATGSDLSRQDSEFLARDIAGDADRWIEKLKQCYNENDDVRQSMLAGQK